jgi:amidase
MSFVLSVAGPLCLDLEGIEIFFNSLSTITPALHDSTILDIPWRKLTTPPPNRKLRIGLFPEHPIFPLHPPIKRTLASAASLLAAAGHEIIPLTPAESLLMELNEVAMHLFGLDTAAQNHVLSAGEPLAPALKHIATQIERLRPIYTPTITPNPGAVPDKLERLAVLNARRAALHEAYRALWTKYNLDACLAPPAQSTAVPHDGFGLAPYTIFLNCLDVSWHFLAPFPVSCNSRSN